MQMFDLIKSTLKERGICAKRTEQTRYIDLLKATWSKAPATQFKAICENNGRGGCCVREKRDAYDGPFFATLREDGVMFLDAEDDALKAFLQPIP